MSIARALILVSRWEFAVGGTFFLFAVSALALRSWADFGPSWSLIACGVGVWYMSHLLGSHVNCLADQQLDRYHKKRLAEAVDRLGRGTLRGLIAAESAAALALSGCVGWLSGRWALTGLWCAGWVLTMGYSLEPVRFKRRGLLNPICLVLVLYALPIAFGYFALTGGGDLVVLLVLVGVGLQMFSCILLNPAEDIPEDRVLNIDTPCVRYGLRGVAAAACGLFALGSALLLGAFPRLIPGEWERWLFVAAALVAQALVAYDMLRLSRVGGRIDRAADDPDALTTLRRLGKRNAFHFAVVGLTFCVGSALSLR